LARMAPCVAEEVGEKGMDESPAVNAVEEAHGGKPLHDPSVDNFPGLVQAGRVMAGGTLNKAVKMWAMDGTPPRESEIPQVAPGAATEVRGIPGPLFGSPGVFIPTMLGEGSVGRLAIPGQPSGMEYCPATEVISGQK